METYEFIDNSYPSSTSFFSFQGRCNRKAYWSRLGQLVAIGFLLGLLSVVLTTASPIIGMIISLPVSLVMGYCSMCLQARRFHDLGMPGIIPFTIYGASLALNILIVFGVQFSDAMGISIVLLFMVGLLTTLVIGCLPGQKGMNKYGSNPLYDFDYQVEQYNKQHPSH